jgi:hypothetical protein
MKCDICGNDAPELYPSLVPDHWECERCLKHRLEDNPSVEELVAELEDLRRAVVDELEKYPPAGVYAYAAPFPPWEEP